MGCAVNIPPKGQRGPLMPDDPKQKGQSGLGIVVDRIECTDAKMTLETSKPGKKPLEFEISSVVLTDVGAKKPLNYTAVLVNPKPVGDVRSTGHFGPWQKDNPRDTPIDGDYEFTHADLSSIHGTGRDSGVDGKVCRERWGRLRWRGWRMCRRFGWISATMRCRCRRSFNAVVDGTTGDTRLDWVKARVGRSELTATGSVTRATGVQGHTTDLHAVMEQGRIEDMLTLAMKGSPALMRGALATKVHIVVPPGPVSVSRKMRLEGTFAIHDALLNNVKMQQQLDAMSERAQGNPKLANAQDAAVVGSSMSGTFSQADAVMQIPELNYQMPGAQVTMNGTDRTDREHVRVSWKGEDGGDGVADDDGVEESVAGSVR